MQQDGQGWSFTDDFVCVGCVQDDALERAIRASEHIGATCAFCGANPAAPLDELLDVFVAGQEDRLSRVRSRPIKFASDAAFVTAVWGLHLAAWAPPTST